MLVESAQEGTSQDRCLWAGVAENTPGFHRGGGREDLGEDCFEREDSGSREYTTSFIQKYACHYM